jgi:uncharacterized membrane protein YdjX (TVP38/TMEM64 family)
MSSARTSSPRRRWIVGVALAMGAALLVIWYLRSDVDLKQITERIAGFNGFVVFLLMATLPVGGFSIGLVYLVAGIKFGPVYGGLAVAGATAVHLLASHWVCQTVLREPLQRFLKRRNHELPHAPGGAHKSVAAMAALVPGLPYVTRNYLLALTDIPLRVYFWVCLPIYVIRSYLVIMLGDIGTDVNRKTLAILIGVYVLKLSICGVLLWHIRRRMKQTAQAHPRRRILREAGST